MKLIECFSGWEVEGKGGCLPGVGAWLGNRDRNIFPANPKPTHVTWILGPLLAVWDWAINHVCL